MTGINNGNGFRHLPQQDLGYVQSQQELGYIKPTNQRPPILEEELSQLSQFSEDTFESIPPQYQHLTQCPCARNTASLTSADSFLARMMAPATTFGGSPPMDSGIPQGLQQTLDAIASGSSPEEAILTANLRSAQALSRVPNIHRQIRPLGSPSDQSLPEEHDIYQTLDAIASGSSPEEAILTANLRSAQALSRVPNIHRQIRPLGSPSDQSLPEAISRQQILEEAMMTMPAGEVPKIRPLGSLREAQAIYGVPDQYPPAQPLGSLREAQAIYGVPDQYPPAQPLGSPSSNLAREQIEKIILLGAR